jgi:hypothetical protein
MASAAYESASPRSQELLRRSAQLLGGFSAENDITSVTYAAGTEVPESISFSNANGSATREVVSVYGSLGLRSDELQSIRTSRLTSQIVNDFDPTVSGVTSSNNRQLSAFSRNATNSTLGESLSDDLTGVGSEVINTGSTVIRDAVNNRLENSGLGRGAEILSQVAPDLYANIVGRFPSAGGDTRVKISDPSGRISQLGGALQPLRRTDFKVVFPYTPEISINHQANYQDSNPTHSNYEYLFYQHSVVSEITINAIFTARNAEDAEYVLAAQHFFRSATKMFYGNDDIAGLPPIVCRLEGHGDLQFSYVPIVVTGFNVTLPSDVDYISAVNTRSNVGRVPTMQTMNITAKPIYSRNRITNEFSLTEFARGNLLGDPNTRRGGFI